MTPHGGYRPGAGRKPKDPDGRRRVKIQVWLPAALLREIEVRKGDELRSHYIRRILQSSLERKT